MFTGIIESTGLVEVLRETEVPGTFELVMRTSLAKELQAGDSLASNGCCLTTVGRTVSTVRFDLLAETVRRTNLGTLKSGDVVNLERPLPASGRFDGHIVQGHVDATGDVLAIERAGRDHRIEISFPSEFAHYVAFKGSIAVNGISLTVAEIQHGRFATWIIPHTWEVTNLRLLHPGVSVNLEFDLIAKYVERMMRR
ncbi:MAG: riboflavin synthase [Chthoniobacterales bacterium]